MPTTCFWVREDHPEDHDTPGAIIKITLNDAIRRDLSTFYWRDHADKREPLGIILPDFSMWIIDRTANNGPGWEITGEAPAFTARPSVDSGTYHGWLTDGVLSDDLDGRTYPPRWDER